MSYDCTATMSSAMPLAAGSDSEPALTIRPGTVSSAICTKLAVLMFTSTSSPAALLSMITIESATEMSS